MRSNDYPRLGQEFADDGGMSAGTSTVAQKQMLPLLGMMWRGMWGATVATAAAQVIAAEKASDDLDDNRV